MSASLQVIYKEWEAIMCLSCVRVSRKICHILRKVVHAKERDLHRLSGEKELP